MIESPMYQEILAEGRTEGQLNTKRDDIREALAVRFGPEDATEFTAALRGIGNLDRLSDLFRLAVGCRRLTEFRKAIDPATDK